ncbi:uncharacterized protein PV07_04282 [Cladophialophora immunda]|uniref:Uncharacterized protein n=1 Tax=Cladophialophora immunda TaxID=569365 RepID=A0A0D2CNB7_9EURO|nr:uncharacterized protein PV07_04282 [Cladophialophora immunda]KIW32758.1 hypothetical protein PV07_04282 [Cladophialophora immunda]OQU95324.1 hypothetical protein CLAIMM_01549 [Cladophialophora immunda]
MDERSSATPTSYHQSTIQEHAQESPSDTHLEEQLSIGFDPEDSRARSPASPHEPTPYGFTREDEEIDSASSAWVETQSSSSSPKETDDQPSREKDKGKEREMSYPGDYYHSTTTSSPQDRRPEISRTSPSSSASTPRQGSEEAKSDDKKDDRTGGGSGSGSSGGGGSGSASASGSSRSRLVAGVFVRY